MDKEIYGICPNITVDQNGELLFAGQNVAALAKQYGTPVYFMDENRIRERCRTYINAANAAFGGRAKILYASKAASFKRMYEIMKDEGMGTDVVSSGEIYSALTAGFPLKDAYFHSNNKTDEDIAYAMENGVGHFVADCAEELFAVNAEAQKRGILQKILLRITPGIDPHTYEAISTGKVDSKFGSAIETAQAEQMVKTALGLKNIQLDGFHCHVGSQVFDSDVYIRTADVMLTFIADIKESCGYIANELDLGGGYGVRYTKNQPYIDIAANIAEVAAFMKQKALLLGIELPVICFEPGRSIVADAGLTAYTAGSVKRIPGFATYVSVDGGMTDNIRFALYGAPYTVLSAKKMNTEHNMRCSVVGRCCESGDIIQKNVLLPDNTARDDIIAVLTTGAYHYSMASNYNRLPKPPVVMLYNGSSYIAVKRETNEYLSALDI